jgi:hypothetical protein
MSRCGALGLKAIVMPLVLCFAGRMRPRPMCVEDIEPARDSAASPAEQTGSRFRARSLSSLREPESEVDTTVGNLMDSDAAKPHRSMTAAQRPSRKDIAKRGADSLSSLISNRWAR